MKITVNLAITFSKILAFALIACAMVLDLKNGGGTVFMFTVPFASALILGKQYIDGKKVQAQDSQS